MNEDQRSCVREFFFTKIRTISEISERYDFREKYGFSLSDLGPEKVLELVFNLFQEGVFKLWFTDRKNYFVVLDVDEEVRFIHEVSDGLVIL